MPAGDPVDLRGLLGWMPDFGLYVLLMEGGFYRVLSTTDPDPKLVGGRVRIIGRSGGGNLITVDKLSKG